MQFEYYCRMSNRLCTVHAHGRMRLELRQSRRQPLWSEQRLHRRRRTKLYVREPVVVSFCLSRGLSNDGRMSRWHVRVQAGLCATGFLFPLRTN